MTPSKLQTAFTVTFAVLMMTAAGFAAADMGAVNRVSPTATDAVGVTGYSVPDEVVRYGADANPGMFVTVESRADLDSLEQWADSSQDRTVVQRYNESNTYLIAAPMADVQRPTASPSRWLPGGDTTLTSLGYVTGLSFDLQAEYVEPVRDLDGEQSFTRPTGAWWAEATTSGEYTADAMAWNDDAEPTSLARTSELVGADGVSETGAGVNVAVIDTGVNFANGTLFGNGTKGSDMRVTDAYDFVENEGADLTVDRANLSTELETVEDPNGHGSWVASAAVGRDGISPGANLMAYRALNSEGQGSTADIREAIARADREGADIIVMSLGSPMFSDAMANELRRALGENGNVTGAFIAAGNSYSTTRYVASPADVEAVIGVSATNPENATNAKKAYFANTGPDSGLDGSGSGELNTRGNQPDTAAPGMKLTAPVAGTDGRVSDRTLSGTSMAAPIAAGVGALTLEADPTLKGDSESFRDRIVNSGAHTPNIGVTESEGGMVNATRAISGYDSADAPNRDLPSKTKGRDSANRMLIGDVGLKLAQIDEWSGALR